MWTDVLTTTVGDFLSKTASSLFVFAIGGYIHLWTRMQKIESKVETIDKTLDEKNKSMAVISAGQEDHATRIAVIESVIKDLKELVPALQNIGNMNSKMEVLIQQNSRRIEMVENHLLKSKS